MTDRDRWNERYVGVDAPGAPSPSLVALAEHLPRTGSALDVAAGTGRHALWLARRGLDVTAVDVSEVGLAVAQRAADAERLPVRTIRRDLERDGLPDGRWDLILVSNFLHRPLFETIPAHLDPGGLLVVVHPTQTNLQRHPRPGAAHLLGDRELPSLVDGLELVLVDEGWTESGRHEARLIARAP